MEKILVLLLSIFILGSCSNNNASEGDISSTIPDTVYPEDYWTNVDYNSLARTPEGVTGANTNLVGRIVQVIEGVEEKYTMYLLSQNVTGNLAFFYIESNRVDTRIIENDEVRFYGVGDGMFSYETVEEIQNTLPLIYVHDYEIYSIE